MVIRVKDKFGLRGSCKGEYRDFVQYYAYVNMK